MFIKSAVDKTFFYFSNRTSKPSSSTQQTLSTLIDKIADATSSLSPFDVSIGDMPARVVVDLKLPVNVMSTGCLRKFFDGRHKYHIHETIQMRIEGVIYCGQLSARIKNAAGHRDVNFFLIERKEDYVSVNRKTAQSLKLMLE